jgi:hypothetical protein
LYVVAIATTTNPGSTTPGQQLDDASDKQIRELEAHAITRHDWHGEWNYSVSARADP